MIEDTIRFTFQFAKRFGWLTLRYGIKESTGGVGADVDQSLVQPQPRLSVDVFDATFDKYPRVKLDGGVRGVPPRLHARRRRRAAQHAADARRSSKGTSDVPVQFDTFRFGRDYFLGGMLRFNDEDLAALLTVGGSALAGAGGSR